MNVGNFFEVFGSLGGLFFSDPVKWLIYRENKKTPEKVFLFTKAPG